MQKTISQDLDFGFIEFAEQELGFNLYPWQCDTLQPFDDASLKLIRVSLRTPNGSGKSAVIIPALVLGWLAMYPQGRVVLTTADGRQLDGQVMPAIEAHRLRFPDWKFIERHIETPTGGRFDAFTTDDAGRAEGWHKLNDTTGPLLVIADEAKTVPEQIFSALDRCTYNAMLIASSPGRTSGRFYESQVRTDLDYIKVSIGLLDCPHIKQDKIDRIIAEHGKDSSFTRSTLHGEFMISEDESKFDRVGLEQLMIMAKAGHGMAKLGVIENYRATGSPVFMPAAEGAWLWMDEAPEHSREYLIACDPNTCEQAEGTNSRDNTACVVLRKGYTSSTGIEYKDMVVACLHWKGGVKWDSDILSERIVALSKFYGGCMIVVESNNFGGAVIKDLQKLNANLWRRTKIDDINPNKQVRIYGFLTTQRTREHWVQAVTIAIRDQSFICRYLPAVNEFATFIVLESGRSEAQQGCHDDWVSAIGIGLSVQCWTKFFGSVSGSRESSRLYSGVTSQANSMAGCQFGVCG